jgi:hypothetical protein
MWSNFENLNIVTYTWSEEISSRLTNNPLVYEPKSGGEGGGGVAGSQQVSTAVHMEPK